MRDYLPWLGVIFGIWLIVAPFVLGYSTVTNAMWNDIIVGVVVAVISFFSWYTASHRATAR